MDILYILWTVQLLNPVWACSVTATAFEITSSFVNLAAPRTLNLVFTYTWLEIGDPCTGLSFTDYQTIAFAGQSHYAEPVTIMDAPLPETVTLSFPDLTLTSLYTDGPDVIWTASWVGEIVGGGTQLIILPSPSPPYTTKSIPVATTTLTGSAGLTQTTGSTGSTGFIQTTGSTGSTGFIQTTGPTELTESVGPINTGGGGVTTTSTVILTHSSGLSSGAIGGIVGGVLAGLIVLVAIGVFCCLRRPKVIPAPQPIAIGESQQPYYTGETTQSYYQGGAQQGYQQEYKPPPPPEAIPTATAIRYPEPSDNFSGRTDGNY